MTELDGFIGRLREICNDDGNELTVEKARSVIREINEFLYTTSDELGNVNALNTELAYFSEFHKFWKEHHREILNITIDEDACIIVANALHDVYCRTNGRAFNEVYDICALNPEEICRIRMLTANQDFRGSRRFSELAQIYRDDPSIFDERTIYEEPEEFVKGIGLTNLSQTDKRTQFAKNISKFLIDIGASPYSSIDCFNRNVYELRQALIECQGAGYGNKKADMFVRDMVVLNVWDNVQGFELVDVASDVNTIKVALRTGIIKSEIPLVSSFIDIFSYQYDYVDEMNAAAWRHVWEIWVEMYPNETIASPCLLDFFVYSVVGKQFCKETLCLFECETGEHQFKWHSPRNKTCQICHANRARHKAGLIGKTMPCTDADGRIAICETDFVRSNIANPNLDRCPFAQACELNEFNMLLPPKSISILGQTGWATAYTKKGQGGGGLMA